MPRLAREVLDRDVLELRRRLDEELDDRVRVGAELRDAETVLLDQREARALLGDDEQAPEERAALDRVRDPDVERLLELDARAGRRRAGRASTCAALCAANFSSRADELCRGVVRSSSGSKTMPVGRALDLDPGLARRAASPATSRSSIVSPGRAQGLAPVRRESVRVEARAGR